MKTLPLRFTLLKVLEERGAALEPAELYEAVKGQYPNEKQCTPSAIDEHMMSMRGVGLVDVKDCYENADKQLICKYELTGYGKEKVKQHICLSHGGKNA